MTNDKKTEDNPVAEKPQTPKRKGVFLEVPQAQQIVNYLQSQPYSEVAGLINHLLRAPEVTL